MPSRNSTRSFDWSLWFLWTMATTVGWVLGRFLLPSLAWIIIGIGLGVMQSLALQHRIPRTWRWLIATAAGWTIGALLIPPFNAEGQEFIVGMILGLTTGFCQWLILRKEVNLAGWWIVIMLVGWTSGLALLPGILLTGVIAGAVTGFGLELLLRVPKQKPIETE